MKGDFSRLTFDVTKHFSRVLMQQGRVQLDADWNEQTAILLHYLQTLAKDLIGEHGGPRDNLGFGIKKIDNVPDFQIGNGRYYASGILAENESLEFPITVANGNPKDKLKLSSLTINGVKFKEGQYLEVYESTEPNSSGIVKITGVDLEKLELTVDPPITNSPGMARRIITYKTQDDFLLLDKETLEKDSVYLVYLDLWERHITYIEDDSIQEVALGETDTASRAKLVWQVKITDKQPNGSGELKNVTLDGENGWRDWVYKEGENRWSDWKKQWQPANRGLLKARAKHERKKDDSPCITSPESSFRGAENQLYRVEIHQGGKAEKGDNSATFKWSRDNGSIATGVKLNGTELTVNDSRRLCSGQWVELINDGQELRGEPGTLVKIKKIDCDLVSLETDTRPTPVMALPKDEVWPTKARLWESDQITILESNGNTDKDWHKLENGIQIQFQPSTSANHYRTGDYWLIPARVATGDVEWPGEEGKPEALPPHGIEHHYAPLAIISLENSHVDVKADLRWQIKEIVEPV